jgi:acetoacetate decarboxylase
VDNDFTLARGWFMGFPKKLGSVRMTEFHPLNPGMPKVGPGVTLKGIASANDERLFEGSLTIEKEGTPEDLPDLMTSPLYHIRHFPSIEKDAPPSVLELVTLGSENRKTGEVVWMGKGNLAFFPSEIEEHMLLEPREVLGAFAFSSGYTFPGGKVLHSWV